MKRSPELTPLSHDHHQALFAAQGLKRAKGDGQDPQSFLTFWEGHGRRHFRIEEEILLPGWIERDPEADPAMAARVAEEHLAIRGMVRRLRRTGLSVEELRELGGMLERHVRFEERELFPRIEAGLPAEAIGALGAEIAAAEEGDGGDAD